jgi:hypothetical protein
MTTAQTRAAARVTYQLETLYETAKKNQWNGSTAIDWSRPVGKEGAVLNVQMAFAGTNFFTRLTPEEQKEQDDCDRTMQLFMQNLHEEQLLPGGAGGEVAQSPTAVARTAEWLKRMLGPFAAVRLEPDHVATIVDQ